MENKLHDVICYNSSKFTKQNSPFKSNLHTCSFKYRINEQFLTLHDENCSFCLSFLTLKQNNLSLKGMLTWRHKDMPNFHTKILYHNSSVSQVSKNDLDCNWSTLIQLVKLLVNRVSEILQQRLLYLFMLHLICMRSSLAGLNFGMTSGSTRY